MSFDSPSAHQVSDKSRRRRRRRVQRPKLDWVDRTVEGLLILVVIGSALAIGTVHRPALLAVSAIAVVGGTLGALAFQRLPVPTLVLGALGLFSALQALPLPASWVLRLSPASAQIWLRCLSPFGEQLTRFPISLDAGASVAEALKWLTYAAVYIMAAHVRSQRGSGWLAALLFASAALVALITLLHGGSNIPLLYGVYAPNFSVGRWNVGPLLNSNNFAGYANLGLFAGAGLLLSARATVPRAPSLFAIGVLVTALLLSGSRAGVLSTFACGGAAALWLTRGRRARSSPRVLLVAAAPFLLGIAAAVLIGTSKDWAQLASVDIRRKVAVWRWSLPLIREHAWLGVGRGAFETALPPYRKAFEYDWTAVASHAENFVVQWLAEWGVPIGLCAAVAVVGYILYEWFGARSDRLRFMVLTGLAAVLLQNLADLGLEIPAIAIASVVALAAGERPSRVQREQRMLVLPSAFAVATPLLMMWAACALWARWPVEVERRDASREFRLLGVNDAEGRSAFREHLREAMLRHPGESFFPLLGSVSAYQARDSHALVWLGRALELGPTNGHAHFVLAQFLGAHRATAQAMLHLRLASEYDSTLADAAGVRAAQWATSLNVLMQAVPDGLAGNKVLAAACPKVARLELKLDCLRSAVVRGPQDAALRGQLADFLLLVLRSKQWPCNGGRAYDCAEEAEHNARAMADLDPRSWRPGYLLAKILLIRGDPKGAAALLARVCPTDAEGKDCAREALTTAMATGSDEAIMSSANAYSDRACGDSTSCAAALEWIGSTLEAGGKLAFAVTFYSKAAENDSTAARWVRVAERAMQAHLFGVARMALQRAGRSADANENTRAHVEQLTLRLERAAAPGSL